MLDRRTLQRRAEIIAMIRRFLDDRGYLSVETPQLAMHPIPEAHIELFRTTYLPPAYRYAVGTDAEGTPAGSKSGGGTEAAETPAGSKSAAAESTPAAETELFLLPSPEYYLKQLIAAGSGSIYEITHSFRNVESIGPHHNPEFTMLEYYTVDADGDDSLAITRDLLKAVGVNAEPLVMSMSAAFAEYAGVDLEALLAGGEAALAGGDNGGGDAGHRRCYDDGNSGDAAPPPAERNGHAAASATDSLEDRFQRTFLTAVEPELPKDRPVFITHYPAIVPTLARRIPGTPWADRWELYLGGIEVANCFGEETDPDRIAAFLADQGAIKLRSGEVPHPWDADYLGASTPLPRCSGVALGVDRLVMHLLGVEAIERVISFPLFR